MNDNQIPAALTDCEIDLLAFDPLLGILRLETESGHVEITLNRTMAGMLAGTLVEFLATIEGDEDDVAEVTEAVPL